MSNLLSEKDQKKIARGYRARIVFVGALLMFASAIVAVLALLPSYVILFSSRPQESVRSALVQNKADEKDLTRAQTVVNQIFPIITASSTISDAISAALARKPKGVHIDHVTYKGGRDSGIVVTGAAESRTDVNLFRDSLSKDGHFVEVSVPVGALIGTEGGRFTVTLHGNF